MNLNKSKFSILLLFLFPLYSFAQIKLIDSIKIDSSTFVKTRESIIKLPFNKFQKLIFKKNDKELPYRLLTPKNFNKNRKYPLIITFHNSTRIGNDNEKQLEPLSKIWIRDEIYEKYKCFVVAPQFNTRSSNYIKNDQNELISKPSEDINLVLELFKELELKYPSIDKSRIFLVGYSMGASTAQNLLSLAPNLFSNLVSIAGVPDLSNLKAMSKKKIMLIHGQKDVENPYDGSELLYKKLNSNSKISFKSYTELNHDNINIPFLLNDDIPKWLFRDK